VIRGITCARVGIPLVVRACCVQFSVGQRVLDEDLRALLSLALEAAFRIDSLDAIALLEVLGED
jgi:hypothetical protein